MILQTFRLKQIKITREFNPKTKYKTEPDPLYIEIKSRIKFILIDR